MNNKEAVNWLINISADIGKAEHSDLWHYEQALTEIKDMLESAQPEPPCYLGSPCEYQNPDVVISQPEEHTENRTETHACDSISRQAVKHLDLFTKTYCRDKSVKDDLVFRCNQCDFQLPDGTCLVKTMARKLCPDYREFGSMGDL